ncbi:hypothetical protein ACJDU8_13390 [Clostridium sp. WILCCON 0269]|uniref:Transposase n=1 Tax=Candidatus Clostridium eludens TaxID=3381663 RepID=A0ABW8SL85_9CLOT
MSKNEIYELRKKLNLLMCEKNQLEKEILEVNSKLDKIIGELIHKNMKNTIDKE